MAKSPSIFIPIIDTSSVPGGDEVFAAVQTGEAAFLNALPKGDQFAVLGYAADARQIYPASGLARADAAGVAAATLALTDVTPAGSAADVAAALAKAVPLIPDGASVLLIGRNEETPADSTAADRAGKPSAAPINTLGAGDQPPVAVLRAVSAATGGGYVGLAGAAEIETYFFKSIDQTGTVVFEGTRDLSVTPLVGSGSTPGGLVLAIRWTAQDDAGGELPFTITIVQPNEKPWTKPPAFVSGSFVIYNIRDAAEGEWTFTFKQNEGAPAATVQVMALAQFR
jgi:hypothetical protein